MRMHFAFYLFFTRFLCVNTYQFPKQPLPVATMTIVMNLMFFAGPILLFCCFVIGRSSRINLAAESDIDDENAEIEQIVQIALDGADNVPNNNPTENVNAINQA